MKYFISTTLILLCALISYPQNRITVITEKANLRGTPNQNGKVVSEVKQDDDFELINQKGSWYLVQTPDFVGWLHGNTIKLNNAVETVGGGYDSDVPVYTRPTTPRPQRVVTAPRPAPSSSNYIRGPRGGCYYINSRGNKSYVDRSLCN